MRLIYAFASLLCFAVLASGCSRNQTAACEPALDPNGCIAAPQCSGVMQDCKNGGIDGCETDTSSDVLNCGGCGIACTAGPGLHPICSSGVCGASTCDTGFAECNLDASDGCEADTRRDPQHCGTCATACPGAANAAPACSAGQCKIVCQGGYLDCDGDPSNGCEVNGSADIANCGSCKNACPTGGVGNPACAAGTCIFSSCIAPYRTCKPGPVDRCETDSATSLNNCGSCGNACPAVANGSPDCQNSNCGIGSCNAGFDNCDGMLDNGCESSLATDVNNCGACGKGCAVANATPSCTAATCGISSCNAGFDNCDGVPANGCEVNIMSSAANCNGCNLACPMGNICSMGMCQAPPTGQVPGTPINTPATHNPLAPWVADVNADGKLDILVANAESGSTTSPSGSLSVFFGNGDATVQPEQYYTGATLSSNAVVATDVDADGWIDAVTVDGQTNLSTSNGSISVYRNQGPTAPGTFSAPTSFTTGAPGSVHLCAGDFDKNGHIDIATVSVVTNQVSVLFGNGAGGFAAPVLISIMATGGVQSTIACQDMNIDGFPDIEVTSPSSARLSILINQKDGTFAAPVAYANAVNGQTAGLSFGDADGDGKIDIIANGAAGRFLFFFKGNDDGTVASGVQSTVSSTAVANSTLGVVTGDFNGDGKLDAYILHTAAAGGVYPMTGNGDGSFTVGPLVNTGTSPGLNAIAVADLNGNGYLDLVLTNKGSATLTVIPNGL